VERVEIFSVQMVALEKPADEDDLRQKLAMLGWFVFL